MVKNRIKSQQNCQVDFNQKINFKFEGKKISGYKGDTISSALWAQEVKILGRSFKYHRPRGVFSLTGQDGNTLVALPKLGLSNVQADTYPISEGLIVEGQHYSGSLKNDRLSFIGKMARFLPVGFYYKAFYKYDHWNKIWENFFRRYTGLGSISTKDSNNYYDKQYLFYDVVVVGGGPAGLLTALKMSDNNLKVLLVDENPELGGSLNYARFDQSGKLAYELKQKYLKKIKASSIEVMTSTTCNGLYEDNWLALIHQNRLYKTRAKQLMLCSGGFEQPVTFNNNDLPGIMLSTGAQRLINLYGVQPGQKAVVVTGENHGYQVVLDLLEAGVEVVSVVDFRSNISEDEITQAVKDKGVSVLKSHAIYNAKGKKQLNEVEIRQIDSSGKYANDTITKISCDLLCMHGGYMPAFQLPCYLGAKLKHDQEANSFIIADQPNNCHLIGGINQASNLDEIKAQVDVGTYQALSNLNLTDGLEEPKKSFEQSTQTEYISPIFSHPKGKEFIDFDEDLKICDLINAVKEGYEDIQLAKRFSTFGMGPAQGRYTAFTGAYLLANHDSDKEPKDKVGISTARPPYNIEKIGHMAGRAFFPERHSSIHQRHLQAGAQMLIAGAWMRPAYYGDEANSQRHINEEVLNVHLNVGLVDVSTLGGLEIRGPDAGEFLNRMYTWGYAKQPVGRARYALMTNEAGIVIDDGVACRFSEEHYYVTATTSGVDNVYLHFLRWNAQWHLNVDITNATSAWCGVNIAGPLSRKVLAKVCQDIDLSKEAFPYMGVRTGTVAGIKARILRVGFVGELGYEVHVPQHYGESLWDSLMQAGEEFSIKPFGIEAQRILRMQKGHVIIGQDTDSMTFPNEINMGWAVSNKKPFFMGKKSIDILNQKPQPRTLIGFEVNPNEDNSPQESNLVYDLNNNLIGRITSCGYAPVLQKVVGMAFVQPDCSQVGDELIISLDNGKRINVTITKLPFYDHNNKRQEL